MDPSWEMLKNLETSEIHHSNSTFLWSSPGSSDPRSSCRVAKYHADLEDDERIAEIAAKGVGRSKYPPNNDDRIGLKY